MSLVVVTATGPTTSTLPLISSVPGLTITIKDNGSASVTNTITIQPTAGNTFESGVASYILNTPLAYITFIGNPTTLKWRVLATSYADVPITISAVAPATGTLGGITGTLATLSVSGLTTLGNTSNTGNLGVAGTTTLSTLSATNINFSGGLYSNGVLFTGGSGSPTFSTISTIGQAAFYSSMQIQGGLSVFSSLTAKNINFTGLLTSNGTTFSGAPAGINSAGSIGIGGAAGATTLLVTGSQSNTGILGVAGNTTLGGTLNAAGGFTGRFTIESWMNSTDGRARILYYNNSSSVYGTGDRHYFRNNVDANVFDITSAGAGTFTGTLVAQGGFYGTLGNNQWITSFDTVPRLYFATNGDTFFYTATNSSFYFQSPAGNVANINGNSGSYTVMSDQRIKKNILITRDSLDIINQINIVSYDYIDSGRGSVKHGIVAQQLKQVYPDAVDTLRNVIPSHLTVVDFDLDASENIIIKCSTPHELLVNDTVKLDIDNKRLDKVIFEVPSDTTFIVSSWDNFSATSSVSLYGKYVDDFLSYDKSQLGILAAGACKVLSGQVSTLQSESSNTSTITGQQASTITGLESTIAAILQKYPL